MVKQPDIDIILVTWNALPYLKKCLASIRRHTSTWPYRLIVVDNGSTDGTTSWLRTQKNIILLHNRFNAGITRATNQALRQSRAPWHVRLSDDAEVTPKWLDKLWESAQSFKKVGMVGCLGVTPEGRIEDADGLPGPYGWVWNGGYELDLGQRSYVKSAELVAGCTLRPRWIHEAVGLYDERLSDASEDVDFKLRLRLAGFRAVYNGTVRVLHHQLHRRRRGRPLKNREWFQKKWHQYSQFPLKDSPLLDRSHLLAMRFLACRHPKKALNLLARVKDMAPQITTRFLEGLGHLHCKDYNMAELKLKSLTLFSARANYLIGAIRGRQRQWDAAARAFQKALEIAPHFSPAYSALSFLYLKQGEIEPAQRWIEKGIKKFPEFEGFRCIQAFLSQKKTRLRAPKRDLSESDLWLYPVF